MNYIKDNGQRKTTATKKHVIREFSDEVFTQAFFAELEGIKVVAFSTKLNMQC